LTHQKKEIAVLLALFLSAFVLYGIGSWLDKRERRARERRRAEREVRWP
jgi:hypothetical protein